MEPAELRQLLSSRLERADRALARNWATQMALVILSLLALFGNGTELAEASKEHLKISPSQPVLSGILAALLIYNFIRWGFIVGHFLLTRRECDRLASLGPVPGAASATLASAVTSLASDTETSPIFETTNFFEPVSQLPTFMARGKLALYTVVLITWLVIATSHASAIVHLLHAAGRNTVFGWALVAGLILVLAGCYGQMWRSEVGKNFPLAKGVMVAAPALALLELVVYFAAGRS